MRIKIDFAEAAKYTFDAKWYYNRLDSGNLMELTGNELIKVIQDEYFNGADKAVIYIGFSNIKEYFEFELIPNN